MTAPGNTDALALAGQRAITEATRLWNLDVFDPPKSDHSPRARECARVIEDVIKSAGWGFATPYEGNGAPQWCGLFAGHCWRAAGLDPKWLATYFASTYRLNLWGSYQKFDQKHPNPRPATEDTRWLAELHDAPPFAPQAGDILIVGDGDPHVGDHITLVVSYDAAVRTFDTISGNGGGVGPRGDRREGISRRAYTIGAAGYRAMWLLRPAFGDLVAEAGG
jgi:hypothetical protein